MWLSLLGCRLNLWLVLYFDVTFSINPTVFNPIFNITIFDIFYHGEPLTSFVSQPLGLHFIHGCFIMYNGEIERFTHPEFLQVLHCFISIPFISCQKWIIMLVFLLTFHFIPGLKGLVNFVHILFEQSNGTIKIFWIKFTQKLHDPLTLGLMVR